MIRSIPRAIAAALVGALAGAACLVAAYGSRPEFALEMDRDLPASAYGFFGPEHAGDDTFAWTTDRAGIQLAGLDRRSPWSCTVRFRGARPDAALPRPDLQVLVDGATLAIRRATDEFDEVTVTVPARPAQPGLEISLVSSDTFVPGGRDTRALGVQVDWLRCRPVAAWAALPPRRALGQAALSTGAWGLALGLTGMTAGSALGAVALVAAGQAVPLSTGTAPYDGFTGTMTSLALWIALIMIVSAKLIEWRLGRPLRNTARFVVAFSAGALYLRLLALVHPSKALVDALFHAHRFEWVLQGRFYFTQLSTSATPFPYAIGLYLAAAPWSFLTGDHVTLLRVVVCAAEALTGALVYMMIVRAWGDRLTGAVAVALFNLVPAWYTVVGNANLTHAFGQSVSLAAMAALTIWTLRPGQVLQFVGLTLIVTLAFISHISTLTILLGTLVATALFYRVIGGSTLKAPARTVLLATAAALALAVIIYWGHFGGVYQAQFERMRAGAAASAVAAPGLTRGAEGAPQTSAQERPANGAPQVASAQPQQPAAEALAQGRPALGRQALPLGMRVTSALSQTVANIGWPILILALVGAWRLLTGGVRDRLVCALLAWGAVCLVFVGTSVIAPTDMKYQQDAWEFIGRVEHATYPAAVILAARGAMWAWRAGTAWRAASAALLLGAVATGIHAWLAWLQ